MKTGIGVRTDWIAPDAGCILIVDDDPLNLKLLGAILAGEGHSTVEAANGEEALRLIGEVEPDLILLDIMMPDVDGFEVLERIKGQSSTMNIPVVMVTSLHEQRSRVRALEMGADDYITKPFSKPEMAARVNNLLKVKAYNDNLRDQQVVLEDEVARKTASLKDYSKRLETVSHASVLINSILEVSAILSSVVNAAQDLLECDGGAAGLLEDGELVFREYFWKGTHFSDRFRCDIMQDMKNLQKIFHVECCKDKHPGEKCRFEKASGGEIDERLVIPILDRYRSIMGCVILFNPKREPSKHVISEDPLMGLISSAATALENTKNIVELRKKENDLLASLKEKELLLKEIHHRVKNNLQAIVGLLQRHLLEVETPRDREIFLKGQSLAMAMSMIHELLYNTEDFTRINFADYIEKLVKNALELYSALDQNIRVEIEVDEIHLNADTAIPVSLIVNEIVSNAMTHAFPGKREGKMSLSMNKVGKGGFLLQIADDGIGLSEEVRSGEKSTLGLKLVRSLVENLHGSLEIKVDNGTTFIMWIREYFECENLELR